MKIGVSGASGKLGRNVLESLSTSGGHQSGWDFTFSRRPVLLRSKGVGVTTTSRPRWSAPTTALTDCSSFQAQTCDPVFVVVNWLRPSTRRSKPGSRTWS